MLIYFLYPKVLVDSFFTFIWHPIIWNSRLTEERRWFRPSLGCDTCHKLKILICYQFVKGRSYLSCRYSGLQKNFFMITDKYISKEQIKKIIKRNAKRKGL